jgi:hypothetical protein
MMPDEAGEGKHPEPGHGTLRFGLVCALQFYRRIECYMDNDFSVLDQVSDIEDVVLPKRYDGIERPQFKADPRTGRTKDLAQLGALGLEITADETLRFLQRFRRVQSSLGGIRKVWRIDLERVWISFLVEDSDVRKVIPGAAAVQQARKFPLNVGKVCHFGLQVIVPRKGNESDDDQQDNSRDKKEVHRSLTPLFMKIVSPSLLERQERCPLVLCIHRQTRAYP